MAIDITNSMEYQAVLEKISVLYGDKTQQIINVANTYELTPYQLAEDYLRGSGFEPWYSKNGAVGGYNISSSGNINNASAVDSALNSNSGAATMTTVKAPVETAVNQAGKVEVSSGLTKVATGAKSALHFVSTEVLPAVAATGLGISLGKAVDSALYNLNPDFWDNNGMATLNPETWNSITSDYPDGALKRAFNALFGLNPATGEGQMYIDAQAAAYLAQYMQENGVFPSGAGESWDTPATYTPQNANWNLQYPAYWNLPAKFGKSVTTEFMSGSDLMTDVDTITCAGTYYSFTFYWGSSIQIMYIADEPITNHAVRYKNGEQYSVVNYPSLETGWIGSKKYYHTSSISTGTYAIATSGVINTVNNSNASMRWADVTKLAFNQDLTHHAPASVPGITNQDGATTPDFSGCSTPEDYLLALQSQFPDLFSDAVSQSVVNGDGTTTTRTYLPVGTPSGGNTTQPTTNPTNNPSGQTQGNSGVDPNGSTTNLLNDLLKLITQIVPKPGQDTPTDTGNPDPTGTGTTPPVVAPTGQASALFAVYNPSQAALNSFGAWLWSSNFIDQVLKLFNNPMQSIIGLHKIFAAPPISGSGTIRVGYLDSGVGSNLVGGQYVTVNCGTVKVSENFGNAFDYTDTVIRLYLPFIGIVPLNTSDVMRGAVSVVYHVDVITGACLAEVKVTRDGGGGTLYQYAGDAAVRYPISSGSYMGVVSGVLGVVGGIASAVMTGGASAPLAAGAVASGIANAKTDVQHSGSFAGNAGAMGAKKPYLIIERPQTSIATGFSAYQGVGANSVKRVGAMSGYFRMTDVRVDNVARASAEELEQIRTMIERGVIQ